MDERRSLNFRVRRGAHAQHVIELGGDLDFAAVDEIRGRLLAAADHGTVVLDMAAVTFCDSSGARVLVEADQHARRTGASFRIASPSPSVSRVLGLTLLDQTLQIYPDVDSALNR